MPNSFSKITPEKILQISTTIKNGVQNENPKLELKKQFWDVSTNEGKEEFAKDLTVFANSPYGSGDIIVGIDGNTGEIQHTTLPVDAAQLSDIIANKVQESFTVEFLEVDVDGINIIVVHIPSSNNKPHMLRCYKNRENFIPIRKGTRTVAANRFDLDQMYAEKDKEVTPPYRLEPFIMSNPLTVYPENTGDYWWSCIIHLSNTGSRINLLTDADLVLYNDGDDDKEVFSTKLAALSTSEMGLMQYSNDEVFLKIVPNDVVRIKLKYKIPSYIFEHTPFLNIKGRIKIMDINKKVTFTDIVKLHTPLRLFHML
ncbi:helix-turn-helix domain-containing protein [Brevibacillus laterosporus]|uniref:ATP-binding protein n=1 Tax=Brevibacillus laterosporus TaxID=1465 RepID=A0AAP3DE02_BRELA|nr:ATP-binding protein [Brevibacillus laterosporus]MCR8979494.1 putative DNA binding domain-containing protein [Brevibacillus laterosporus]MCZ0806649.1 ATP-binding protein [Brevibacillus laterosporus]MCZ0825097.1 ATP-binding protein [Brevibacillus laterosporus]MCZ0852065.1 ATP-binding protein [Brevibacillus laterosporus]